MTSLIITILKYITDGVIVDKTKKPFRLKKYLANFFVILIKKNNEFVIHSLIHKDDFEIKMLKDEVANF
jgi:hypothetical protein